MDDLVRRVPPPTVPVDGQGDWAAAEATLGLSLPADFKALIGRYGRGEFCDLLFVYPPFGECTLVGYGVHMLDDDRRERIDFPEDYPYPLYPEPGGLLVWGATSNGDRLCWRTKGAPDDWPVVVWNPRGAAYELHAMGAVAFIEGWLSGRVHCQMIPAVVTDTAQWFDPPRDLAHVYVRLTEGEPVYPRRLRILREALAPTSDRGSVEMDDGARQDHFIATEAQWRVTYETAYGHQIRVAFPPEDDDRARAAILRAAELMGCQVVSATRIDGAAVWTLS
nr:SMI1/KNR4 family protein [Micromonospora sp. DSM 115978]